jgi:hypothetical protein
VLDKFWESVGKGLGDQWIKALIHPGLFFWGVGLLAWVGRQADGWQALLDVWHGLGSLEAQVTALVGLLLLLSASSAGMRWAQWPLLRLMEGYWPGKVQTWAAGPIQEKHRKLDARWQTLDQQVQERQWEHLSVETRAEYLRLDRELMYHYPANTKEVLPTALGNRLRAAEQYAHTHYGLDAIIVWPRLWPLLPEHVQKSLDASRQTLESEVRLFGWGLLTALWGIWAWWAVPLGLGLAVASWFRALYSAEVYGDLVRTAFDLYRFALYEALRWPPPSDSDTEREYGKQLTAYLFRGLLREPVKLAHPQNRKEK